MGVSDIGQGYYRQETGRWARELNLGPKKNDHVTRSGDQTLDLQNICIQRIQKQKQNGQMISMWNQTNRQWTDRPKMDDGQTV